LVAKLFYGIVCGDHEQGVAGANDIAVLDRGGGRATRAIHEGAVGTPDVVAGEAVAPGTDDQVLLGHALVLHAEAAGNVPADE
jgi:hypothetical protein